MTVGNVFTAILNGNLGSFNLLLQGIQMAKADAEMCVDFAMNETGNNTDIMVRSLLTAFNVQISSLASIIENWTAVNVADLDTEVYYVQNLLEESLFSVYCSQTISFMAVPIISDYKSELHGWCYTLNHDKGY